MMPASYILAALLVCLDLADGQTSGYTGTVTGGQAVGDLPTQITAGVTVPSGLNLGDRVDLAYSQNIFSLAHGTNVPVTGALTVALTAPVSHTGTTWSIEIVTARKVRLKLDGAATSLPVASSITWQIAGVALAVVAAPAYVTLTVSTEWWDTSLSTPVWTAKDVAGTPANVWQFYGSPGAGSGSPQAALTGTDPVARYGDREQLFELTPHELTTLLAAPDFVIRGSTFEGGGPWEQWFDRVVLTVPGDSQFLEIKMLRQLDERNYTRVPLNLFRTLDVTMGYGPYDNPSAAAKIGGFDDQVPLSLLGYSIRFIPMKRHFSPKTSSIGHFPRECAEVAGPDLHFYVCSAPALEYYGEQRHLALRYAHLDLAFMETRDTEVLTGLLPELWGLQPMSEATKATLKEPERNTTAAPVASLASWAGAGGLGLENLTGECLEFSADGVESSAKGVGITV